MPAILSQREEVACWLHFTVYNLADAVVVVGSS